MKEPLASRLLFPWTERRFTYAEYERFLDGLASRTVVPLREFVRGAGDLALRHDVDTRLDSALIMARLEAGRGLRGTYFVLHTAPYWSDAELLPHLESLQELGHEVGLHNDLGTLRLVHGVDVAHYVRSELRRLRSAGIDIVGVAAHGSPWCHRLGFHNQYLFSDLEQPLAGFPLRLDPIGSLADFGFAYDAYHAGEDAFFSDARFDGGRRAHPTDFPLAAEERTIVLTHPCHWDVSLAAKGRRLAAKLSAKARRQSAGTPPKA